MINDKIETVVEQTSTKPTTKKTVKTETVETKEENKSDLDIVLKENEDLKKRLDEQANQIEKLLKVLETKSAQASQPIIFQQPEIKKIKVVNLTSDHNLLTLKSDRETYNLKGYGDFKMLDEDEFRAVVRKSQHHFFAGRITTDSEGAKILEERGVKVANRWLTKEELSNLDKLTEKQISDLYVTLHISQQEKLVEAYLDGLNENEKQGFKDEKKLRVLQKLYTGNNRNFKNRINEAIVKL